MRRFINSLLFVAMTTLALAQSPTQQLTPDVKRIGSRLACLCGACNNSVANCPMLHCHYALPAKEKINQMATDGISDDAIVDSFVAERGILALSSPPNEGFHLLSWIMPFVAIAMGLLVIWWFMQRYLGSHVTVPADDEAVMARYRDRIDKDFSELDS